MLSTSVPFVTHALPSESAILNFILYSKAELTPSRVSPLLKLVSVVTCGKEFALRTLDALGLAGALRHSK